MLDIRADVASVNPDDRTVALTFSTGATGRRFDWRTGEYYLEALSLDPKHVRLGRLNSGAPLLNSHQSWDLSAVMGTVVDGSAAVNGRRGDATVLFSRRPDVEPFYQDVRDRVIRKISVGYVVHKYDETPGKNGGLATRTAVDWEPYEVSLVPMPFDNGAQVRGVKPTNPEGAEVPLYPCQITVRSADHTEEPAMTEDRQPSETIVERNPLDPGAPTAPTRAANPAPSEPNELDQAADAERDRIRGIMDACQAAKVPVTMMKRFIDTKVPLVKAQAEIFDELRKRAGDDQGPQSTATGDSHVLVRDNMIHVRAGITNAVLHRMAPTAFPLDDKGRNYRAMSAMDIARAYLQARGVRVTDMTKNQIAAEALGLTNRSGMHTTSDFADLLADVANKRLRKAYDEQPQTWRPLITAGTLPDYKTVKRLQFGDAPSLVEIKEHGEYTFGTIGEGKEEYRLVKYGRKFAITREALINDDLDAFSRLPMMFGRKARILESDLVWAQITSNPTMGDTNALFSAAHSNLQTDGDVISVASLGRARAALRMQTSLDGAYLNLSGRFLLVPTALETKADQFVSVIQAQAPGSVNPFQGKLQVIAEPRLDANSATAWYLAASPDQVDMIEIAYLEGEEGPQVESRIGWDVDGVEVKCRLDFGTKVVDWRGFHKDPGELDS
jgi:hypothetical protein